MKQDKVLDLYQEKSNPQVHELPLINEAAIRHSGEGQSVTETWGGQVDSEAPGWGRLVPGGLWQSLELAGVGVRVGAGEGGEGNHS